MNEIDTDNDLVKSKKDTRPWLRFLARKIDMLLYAVIAFFPLGVMLFLIGFLGFDDGDMEGVAFDVFFGFVFLIVMITIEAKVLSHWQNTPGKKLMGMVLVKQDGERMGFGDAFERTARMWLGGLGLGLPFISLLTQIYAYSNLKEEGSTSWDKTCKIDISHKSISKLRMSIAVGIALLAIALEYVVFYADTIG